jgi:hypothetical protein
MNGCWTDVDEVHAHYSIFGHPNTLLGMKGTFMTSKAVAERVHRSAISAIVELSALLRDIQGTCTDDELDQIRKGVGLSIGTIQTEIMDPLYVHHPELDDLK